MLHSNHTCSSYLKYSQKSDIMNDNCIEVARIIEKFYDDIQWKLNRNMEIQIIIDNINSGNRKILTSRNERCHQSINRIISVARLVLDLLRQNKLLTLRDVYYCLKHKFSNQEECNQSIVDLGSLLKLTRSEMCIHPSAKGYVAGRIGFKFEAINNEADIFMETSTVVSFIEDEPSLISWKWTQVAQQIMHPNNKYLKFKEKQRLILHVPADVKVLLIVEKEGIFSRLCQEQFFNRANCILVTGCGFPDIATRAFVAIIARQYPTINIMGLVDYNPFGVAIILSYKYPCKSSGFEGCGLDVGRLKWLGLRRSHIDEIKQLETNCQLQFQHFTAVDESRALCLIQQLQSVGSCDQYCDELTSMSKQKIKLELEVFYSFENQFFERFLERAILSVDAI